MTIVYQNWRDMVPASYSPASAAYAFKELQEQAKSDATRKFLIEEYYQSLRARRQIDVATHLQAGARYDAALRLLTEDYYQFLISQRQSGVESHKENQ